MSSSTIERTGSAALGAIVLAGGKSSRMGTDKASLELDGEPLLVRVTRIAAAATALVVVVAAEGQALPSLAPSVIVVRDAVPDEGPLRGIATGMAALVGRVEAAFVATTDAPFLHPAFIARLADLRDAGDHDAVIPRVDGADHPLTAIYALRVREPVDELLASGIRRARAIGERVRTLYADRDLLLTDGALRSADPDLASLDNLNTPADYRAAQARR
jgi:molybdenum cofactor guanylyltransferase